MHGTAVKIRKLLKLYP